MQVTLRSDDGPDVLIQASEAVRVQKLDQHIRTLQMARRWLVRENRIRRLRDLDAAKTNKQQKDTPTTA